MTDPQHPMNRVAAFTDRDAVAACFGAARWPTPRPAAAAWWTLCRTESCLQDRLHAAGYLGEAAESASLWTTLFNRAGGDFLCPFLDSRVLRLALNLPAAVRYRFRRPKDLLKRALAARCPSRWRTAPSSASGSRSSSGWPPAASCGRWSNASPRTTSSIGGALEQSLARPDWFLCSLLCYDLWHKLFIDRSLPRLTPPRSPPRR